MQLRQRRLLLLGLGITALVIILLVSVKEDPKVRISLQAAPQPVTSHHISGTVSGMNAVGELTNATYQGQTASGQSWRVQASLAQQLGSAASATVALTSTTAMWLPSSQSATQALALAAPSATFMQNTQTLDLPAGVTLQGPVAGGTLTVQAVTGQANLPSQTVLLQGTLAQPVQVRLMWGPMPAVAPSATPSSVQFPEAL
jgi:hypothetical protein